MRKRAAGSVVSGVREKDTFDHVSPPRIETVSAAYVIRPSCRWSFTSRLPTAPRVKKCPTIFLPSRQGMPQPFRPRFATPDVPAPGMSRWDALPQCATSESRTTMPPSVEMSVHCRPHIL